MTTHCRLTGSKRSRIVASAAAAGLTPFYQASGMNMTTAAAPFPALAETKTASAPMRPRVPVAQMIYQAIVDLGNCNRVATRQVLMEQLGLPYTQVDDHVKRMIDSGQVRRVANGVFEAVGPAREDRAVSITHLPGGGCKLEIGDDYTELTEREVRMVAMATAGVSLLFGR